MWEYRTLRWPRKTQLALRDVKFKASPLFPRPHELSSPPSSSQECHSRPWATACSLTWYSSRWEITGYQRCYGRNLGFRGTWKRAALRSPALLRHPPLLSTWLSLSPEGSWVIKTLLFPAVTKTTMDPFAPSLLPSLPPLQLWLHCQWGDPLYGLLYFFWASKTGQFKPSSQMMLSQHPSATWKSLPYP